MLTRAGMAVCIGLLAVAVPASAQITAIPQPDAGYVGSTTLLTIVPANGTAVNSITAGPQTVAFSAPLNAATVPGGGWSTWGAPPNTETATPRVLVSSGLSVTLTLSNPTTTFGFEIEPNNLQAYSMTATFMNGATVLGTVNRSPVGSSGALLEAASSTTPITSVVISAAAGSGGFAIGQLRYATPTPVPALGPSGTLVLGALLLTALVVMARRRHGATAHD
jgi:hypothetical protein